MKLIQTIILVILIVMSLAAGASKIFQMPQEVQFFETAGLSIQLLMLLGGAQIAGGIFAVFPRYRKPGAVLMGAGFLVSSVVIFMTGNIGFGVFSLLPVLAAGYLALSGRRT